MKDISLVEMARIFEEEDVLWVEKVKYNAKWYLHLKVSIEVEFDTVFRAEVEG